MASAKSMDTFRYFSINAAAHHKHLLEEKVRTNAPHKKNSRHTHWLSQLGLTRAYKMERLCRHRLRSYDRTIPLLQGPQRSRRVGGHRDQQCNEGTCAKQKFPRHDVVAFEVLLVPFP